MEWNPKPENVEKAEFGATAFPTAAPHTTQGLEDGLRVEG